ncbi:MAG: potassium channel family protein [Flavobacteriaceae bacterium]|nr:potassium channel family protein [Flavobacteriaceae bacterium]
MTRERFLENIEKEDSELFNKVKSDPNPDIIDLWKLSEKRFIEWRKIHDFPELLNHFEKSLLLFNEWKEYYGITNEVIINNGKISPFLKNEFDHKINILYLIEYSNDDETGTFILNNKIDEERELLGKKTIYKTIIEFIPYLGWLEERNKTENILKINKRQAFKSDHERVWIHSDFELLKMGGIHPPVNGFGILYRGKYLEFVNLCGLKLSGEIYFGEMGNLECSFSACDNWSATDLEMALLTLKNCTMDNFFLNNSRIQSWLFEDCVVNGKFNNVQLSMIRIIGGNFSPIFQGCFLEKTDIFYPTKGNNLYALQAFKKIYSEQGDEAKAAKYFIMENDFIKNASTIPTYISKSVSKYYWGYGEQPYRIIFISIFIIIIFSVIYFCNSNYIMVNVGIDKSLTIWDSLYFSTTTFTTLGFGDLSPAGNLRILTSIQAFLGLLNMGFLIAGYANKKY